MGVDAPTRQRAERALLDSEQGLQQVLDNSSAIVFAKDRAGHYIFVNREFERVTGRSAAEMLGRRDEEAFEPALAARFRHNDLRVLDENRGFQFEETADFGQGPRTFLSSKFPLLDSTGTAYAVCGMSTDITERKRSEEALRAAALAVTTAEGERVFHELVRYLSTSLDVDAAMIAVHLDGDPTRMRTLAACLDGKALANFEYALEGSPCQHVVGRAFRFVGAGVQPEFPPGTLFAIESMDSYAALPLNDSSGLPLGLIATMDRRPMRDSALAESMLKIFAMRAVAEIERTRADAALRRSEASYRAIFEASEDEIFVHDWETGAFVDANSKACRTFGYSVEELRRLTVAELSSGVPPYTVADAARWIEKAKGGETVAFEWHLRHRDGSLHWGEVCLKSAEIAGTRRILAFTREITARKAAEDALRASEEQYRAIFNASADALVLWNSRSERVDVNPAYEQMYGYSRDEVLRGVRGRDLPPEYRRHQDAIVARTLAGERCHEEIMETLRRNGVRFPIEVRTIPIQYHGEPHVLAMIRDLTERVRVEADRARLEAQLRQAQKMEAIGQLAGGIAHDFNNLLTSIMGYVLLASQRESTTGDPRLAGYLQQAQRSCERARDLIQQMLTFSRGQRGSPRAVSLASVVHGALGTLRAGLPETIEVDLALDRSLPAVHADPAQVEQVLLNLCLNARDAMAGVGQLSIGVGEAGGSPQVCASCRKAVTGHFVQLVVEDDGHGMAPEVLERIFEPFYSTKEPGRGSGMGLAMAHGIVHEHGGHIVVESRPGDGTRFRILWPALPGQQPSTETCGGQAAARAPRPALQGSVLVVDDEETVGEFMRELLESWGLDAACVHRPEAALDLVRAEPQRFDIVITDQSMPRLTGLELARRIRTLRAGLQVVLYTGHGDGLSGDEVDAAGVAVVMRKPVDPAQLSQVLTRCLAAAGGPV